MFVFKTEYPGYQSIKDYTEKNLDNQIEEENNINSSLFEWLPTEGGLILGMSIKE